MIKLVREGNISEVISDESAVLAFYESFLDRNSSKEVFRVERNEDDYVEMSISHRGVFITCEDGERSFETLIPNGKDVGFTPQEFLTDFWQGTHAQNYTFERQEKIKKPSSVFASRISPLKLWPVLFLIIPVAFYAVAEKAEENAQFILWMAFFILVFITPYFLLLLQYSIYNMNSQLHISKKQQLISFIQNGKETSIAFGEITKLKACQSFSGKALYQGWGYLRIEAVAGKRIVITHFLSRDFAQITKQLGKKVVVDSALYPWIRFNRKSMEEEQEEIVESQELKDELIRKWATKSEQELKTIIDSGEYAEHAVTAAMELLKKR